MNLSFIVFFIGLLTITIYLYSTNSQDEIQTIQTNIEMPEQVQRLFQDTHYINLLYRPDRKRLIEKELSTMKIKSFQRFNALTGKNGHIGCSRSHLQLLKNSKKNNHPYIAIVEDDIHFKHPQKTIHQLQKLLESNESWDVIILGGVGGERNRLSPYYSSANGVSSTTGYIVNKKYIDTLIDHWEKGLNKLEKDPEKHTIYALDQTWKQLQKKDKFIILSDHDVVQRSDFSDIQGGYIDYTDYF